jgi:hypothetical protein
MLATGLSEGEGPENDPGCMVGPAKQSPGAKGRGKIKVMKTSEYVLFDTQKFGGSGMLAKCKKLIATKLILCLSIYLSFMVWALGLLGATFCHGGLVIHLVAIPILLGVLCWIVNMFIPSPFPPVVSPPDSP